MIYCCYNLFHGMIQYSKQRRGVYLDYLETTFRESKEYKLMKREKANNMIILFDDFMRHKTNSNYLQYLENYTDFFGDHMGLFYTMIIIKELDTPDHQSREHINKNIIIKPRYILQPKDSKKLGEDIDNTVMFIYGVPSSTALKRNKSTYVGACGVVNTARIGPRHFIMSPEPILSHDYYPTNNHQNSQYAISLKNILKCVNKCAEMEQIDETCGVRKIIRRAK